MIQHYFTSGTTLIVANLEFFNKFNTEQVMQDEIRILVDTSVARTVVLPRITEFPVRNVRITVVDITGSASGNNITVMASTGSPNDAINGSPTYTISTNFGANRFEPLENNDWFVINVGSGGGGAPLAVNMTYAQLTAAIGSSSLITGQSILLTDYQTAYYLQYSGALPSGVGGEQVNIGAVEPLLLTAISSNQISAVAQSISYPEDLILYSVTLPDRVYDYAAAQGKGCIVYRLDRRYMVSRDYDWRTILFRRWETVAGNGNYWSYTPVVGADFRDSLSFGSQVQTIFTVSVRSQLAAGAAFGTTYWLDNTIIDYVNVGNIEMLFCFGNTFIGGVDSFMANSKISQCSDCVINALYFLLNEFRLCSNITITDNPNTANVVSNTISIFDNCTIAGDFSSNNVSEFVDNNLSKANFNTGAKIRQNNMPAHEISENVFYSIMGNGCNGIIGNNFYRAERNSNAGSISGNVCDEIIDNTNAGDILGNIASSIVLNANNGSIENNVMGSNITLNSNVGSIANNVGATINNNTGTGEISQNNVTNVYANTCNSIVGNSGQELHSNVLSGDVSNNSVQMLRNNTETSASGIVGCNSAAFTTNKLGGNIYRITGNVENCTITNTIQVHTFVSEVSGKTITPTASMQSASPATQSMLDQTDDKHYIMLLAGGLLTFPTPITN